jgi:stage II sporulation protein D
MAPAPAEDVPARPRVWTLGRHRLLTASVGLLFGAVGGTMLLSLASCRSTGSGNVPKEVSGTSGKPANTREEVETLARVPAASLSNITAEPEMRVRLASGVAEVEVRGFGAGAAKGASAPVFLGPIGGQAGPRQFSTPLRVQMTAQGWLLTDAGGQGLRLEQPGELVVTASRDDWSMGEGVPAVEQQDGAPGPMVMVTPMGGGQGGAGGGGGGGSGAPYPGRIWLVPRSDLASPGFDVIEHVGLEKYLVGVVVKEMYQNWPKEAFKVQAVAARTYALHERSRGRAKRSFDVEGNTRDQAYAGASSNRNAIEAVNATRGVVMAYNGELLRTYYSSTCGGRTASAKDTWPITKGYEYNLAEPIQAHARDFACQDSPTFAWTVTRTGDDLVRRLRAFGETQKQLVRQISGIYGLEVLETAPTGRPSVYKVIEPGGKWYKMSAEELRVACNTSAAGAPAVTSKTRVNSGDLVFKVTRPAGAGRMNAQQVAAATTVEISGRGFGHGVGMCQYCARAMAMRGDPWQKMLGTFYPGGEAVKAYR